jgi:hypothetical protein
MAHDDPTGNIADQLPHLTALVMERIQATTMTAEFLDGMAGVALALNAISTGHRPRSDWDRCLLLA